MKLDAAGRLQAFVLAGDTRAEAWVLALLQQGGDAAALGRALLAAAAQPPGPVPARSPQVCACLDVSEARIREHLARDEGEPEARLQSLQAALGCGTQCGSCLPTLRRLVAEVPQAA